MKDDEKIFFKTCYRLRNNDYDIRDIIWFMNDFIHHKRCWYLLEKWSRLGFYNYGVTLDLGWFEVENMPNRYLELIGSERSETE